MKKTTKRGKCGKGTRGRVAERNTKKAEMEMTAQPPEPVDFAQVRKNIAALVGSAAEEIARNAMKVAKKGQLAPAKYFFEVAGLYPETAETASEPEDSLAYTLLKRLGLPTEPLIRDGDTGSDSVNGLKPMMSGPAEREGIEIRNGRAACEGKEQTTQQNQGKQDAVK
ncbi:MAG: hypothetical protein WB523_19300 [Candidatus Sulfotelmatobacter sp.]